MKVWRNSEGKEFDVCREAGASCAPNGCAWVDDEHVDGAVMVALGYELVEKEESQPPDEEDSADLVDSAEHPSVDVIREAQREAWEECCEAWYRDMSKPTNPYGPPEDSEEFEVVAGSFSSPKYNFRCLADPRLIPGETYIVRRSNGRCGNRSRNPRGA